MVSSAHNVCPAGTYIAIVSTTVETDKPEMELEPAFKLLGQIKEKFVQISPVYEAEEEEKVAISKSFDSTSHFETVCDDVKRIYKKIMGKELELKSWEELKKMEEE